ncbi:MAG: pyridoxamine 5'-phosphate oxidase family protein [Armatimonadota bacterium]|nr:pyridoxamine 5'-phosphate oxidase family protein [Armatimonadota bacterium]MDR7534940.1 pyridoxamine 5'-phosphate oxidase family protein [Armatimonadota bacterium]
MRTPSAPLPAMTPPDRIGGLTEDERNAFLAQPWNGRLATITPQQTPYVVPVWYEYDPAARVFYIVARERSAYVEHIRANPAVAFHIADDIHLEHTRVLVEGIAEILEGPIPPAQSPRLHALAVALSRKYMGERGPEYAGRTMHRPRYLIRITPQRWHSWTGREWARKYREPAR